MRSIDVNRLARGVPVGKSMGRESATLALSPLDSSLRSVKSQNKCFNGGKGGHLEPGIISFCREIGIYINPENKR